MRHLIFLALFGLAIAPAASQTVVANDAGGFWCATEEDFSKTVRGDFQKTDSQMGPSCRAIAGGTTVKASVSDKKPGMAYGVASFDGKDDVPFLIFQDAEAAGSPASPALSEKRTFKRVSPVDVRNSPSKWMGRPIEFARVQVYWIDEGEIRVLTDGGLTLFIGKYVQNDDVKFFAKECETQDEALSPKCRASVRFVYSKHLEDNPTSSMTRTILISRDAELKRRR